MRRTQSEATPLEKMLTSHTCCPIFQTLIYRQENRVRELESAILTTEVIKEREKQLGRRNKRCEWGLPHLSLLGHHSTFSITDFTPACYLPTTVGRSW